MEGLAKEVRGLLLNAAWRAHGLGGWQPARGHVPRGGGGGAGAARLGAGQGRHRHPAFVLRKTTRACTLPRAIAVAMAAKLTGFVVWIVLSVFVMNAIASLR